MKKFVCFLTLLLAAIFIVAGQEPQDSTVVINYTFGESILEFLKTNAWTLVSIILFLVSEWIGESASIPEGSIWRKALNWLLALAKKKAHYQSPKVRQYLNSIKPVNKES